MSSDPLHEPLGPIPRLYPDLTTTKAPASKHGKERAVQTHSPTDRERRRLR
jgi:hypothetical protein